jgi:hypothetical protein
MSLHMRTQIRNYVVPGVTGLPTTGANVFVGRTRPLPNDHPPALLIYTRTETSVRAVAGRPPLLERPCTLHIEGRVLTASPPDDLLDQIAAEVEAAVAALIDYNAGIFFGGLVQNVELTGTESFAKAEGEKHVGGVALQYRVTYRTAEGLPTANA